MFSNLYWFMLVLPAIIVIIVAIASTKPHVEQIEQDDYLDQYA